MQVILRRKVEGLGEANEIKDVAAGYARNYLFPQGLAVPATAGEIKAAQRQQKIDEARDAREQAHSERIAEQLKEAPLHFEVKAGETGRLYGSVTSKDIAEAIEGVIGESFDRRYVMLEQPIRELGVHLIDLKLEGGVRAQARVVVELEA